MFAGPPPLRTCVESASRSRVWWAAGRAEAEAAVATAATRVKARSFMARAVGGSSCEPSVRGHRRGDEPELLENREPVERQVEGDMGAIAEAEHLDVVQADDAPGRRQIAGRAVEDPVLGPGEGAHFDGDIAVDVKVGDLDVRVREGHDPAAVELEA